MPSNVTVKIEDIKQLCFEKLISTELNESEANIIVEDYLDAELRGKKSHGLAAFNVVFNDAKSRGRVEEVPINPNVILYEGNGDIGHLVARKAIQWAEKVVESHGIAIAGCRNIKRFATPGSVASIAKDKGMIAVVLEYGGQAFMAPPGLAEPVISTNPIGVGVPSESHNILLDMATSQKACYYISYAKQLGNEIPTSWALDSLGNPTSDPSKAHAVQCFGGHKGYSIALMLEIITGILLGVEVGKKGNIGSRGALLIFINPKVFGVTASNFEEGINGLISDIKNANKAPGNHSVYYPGEQAGVAKAANINRGTIDIPSDVYEMIKSLK
jgi:LDH2 family malate/lactate/ureidoglycolate dehydrogenase